MVYRMILKMIDNGQTKGLRNKVDVLYVAGSLTDEQYNEAYETIMKRLNTLRAGPFGERRRVLKEAVWNSMK